MQINNNDPVETTKKKIPRINLVFAVLATLILIYACAYSKYFLAGSLMVFLDTKGSAFGIFAIVIGLTISLLPLIFIALGWYFLFKKNFKWSLIIHVVPCLIFFAIFVTGSYITNVQNKKFIDGIKRVREIGRNKKLPAFGKNQKLN